MLIIQTHSSQCRHVSETLNPSYNKQSNKSIYELYEFELSWIFCLSLIQMVELRCILVCRLNLINMVQLRDISDYGFPECK